jgi:large subunit ribosomal protein L23
MHIYEVLRRPVVTEKSVIAVDDTNQYAFEVDFRANKFQVKEAVETAFDVDVARVNIMVMPAKTTKRGNRIRIRKPKWKKAVVTLAPGNSIQLFEGV